MRRWFCQFRDTAGIIILIILIFNTTIIINDKKNISNYGGSDLQFIIIISARLTITIIIVIPGRLLRLHVCSLFLWLSLCFFSFSLSFPLVFFCSFFYYDSVLCDVWFVFFFIYLRVADSTLAVCRFVFLLFTLIFCLFSCGKRHYSVFFFATCN